MHSHTNMKLGYLFIYYSW